MINNYNVTKATVRIAKHEGFSSKPYKDTVGILTIGYGRNIEENGVSTGEALILLANDIKAAAEECVLYVQGWAELDGVRQEVLVNMMFNMGSPRFRKFVNTLAAVERGDYATAADEMVDSKWARQVGYRAAELSNMMRTGKDG